MSVVCKDWHRLQLFQTEARKHPSRQNTQSSAHIAALRGGVGFIPISQMRRLRPEVTQPTAELEFELGLVALKLLFLLSALAPFFRWCQRVLGPV